jgi:uncharacterized membrane protein YcaP (DUF421 family)
MDWKSIFLPDVPLLEIFLRGSVMYIVLFVLLRLVLKRQTGGLRMTDLLLITLIADAAQNAMSGAYTSVPNGIVLAGTILFWSYSFDWLSYKYAWFRNLTEPPPLPLIQEGKLLRKNMRSELITEDELKSQLREQGLEEWAEVKEAFMESDGHISVIPHERKESSGGKRKEK